MPFRRRPVRRTFKRKPFVRKPVARKRFVRKRFSGMTNKVTTCTLRKGIDQAFPDRYVTKLRNEIVINFTGVAGAVNGWSALGNGLHLPLTNGVQSGANQPSVTAATSIYGLGNLLSNGSVNSSAGVYNNYRIHSSALFGQIQNTSAASADSSALIITPMAAQQWTLLPLVNANTAVLQGELPYSKDITLGGLTVNAGRKFKHAMSTARMYALKYKSSIEDPGYDGTMGTNPANLWYWYIGLYPYTANNTSVSVLLRIEYWIEFFDRNPLASTSG